MSAALKGPTKCRKGVHLASEMYIRGTLLHPWFTTLPKGTPPRDRFMLKEGLWMWGLKVTGLDKFFLGVFALWKQLANMVATCEIESSPGMGLHCIALYSGNK